LLVLVWLN